MSNKNVITAEECMKIMKEHFDNETTVEWCDHKITVKNTISFSDYKWIVSKVVDQSFDADGEYTPECKDISLNACLIAAYTNIGLSEDPEIANSIIYGTDIVDVIERIADKRQICSIKSAIDEKIKELVAANMAQFQNGVDKVVRAMSALSESFGDLFDGISRDDIEAVTNAISNGVISEEKLMNAYIANSERTISKA